MWWPFTSSKPEKKEGAPLRRDRQKCYEFRDAYFACLDRAGVVKAGDEKPNGLCLTEAKNYEKSCAQSWIEYFNQRRVIAEAQKERLAQAGTQAQNARR
ncbi:cytochrome oxidase c subunit VIb-domain-containing protein [Armillaria luteobubalina]|uniref:Cytochrome oxidase c subunit VIb-domain-containing protein n=1 Tax=Armillaria luteobubalina TaxID=153913 RepID=A0AA39Q1S8_9AGAR|nr:cytochrome oxidase c subunit VIb-domain-containing protein [Armillaria luteobubalina]